MMLTSSVIQSEKNRMICCNLNHPTIQENHESKSDFFTPPILNSSLILEKGTKFSTEKDMYKKRHHTIKTETSKKSTETVKWD